MAEGGLLPPVIVELKAKATELKAGLAEAKEDLEKTAKTSEESSSRMGGAMTKATGYSKALAIGIAGAAVTVGGFAVEAATAGEKVDAQLSAAVKNAGGNMEELDPKIKHVDATLRGFGFTNDETNEALTRLTVATKDPAKALTAVSVAADLARSRNIPLATATDLVAKAMAGQTGALTRMGINLPIAAGGAQKLISAQQALAKAQAAVNAILAKTPDAANPASKAHAAYEKATQGVTAAQQKLQQVQNAGGDVLKALESRVKGAASAYGDTLAGKVASAKANLENMGEVIGAKLIPVISTLLGWIMNVTSWLGAHKAVLIAVGGVIFSLMVPAFMAWAAAAWASATATIAAAAPILAIVAVIAAVGVAIYELVTHWTSVWNAIKAATSAVWDFLKGVWNWIKSIFIDAFTGALHGLEAAWSAVWGGIKTALSAVWDFLKSVWSWISGVFIALFQAELHGLEAVFSAVWGGIRSVFSGVWGFIQNGIAGIMNWIHTLGSVIQSLGSIFSSVFGAIRGAVSDAWNVIKGIFDAISRAVGGVIHTIGSVVSTIGSVAGKVGHFLGFDNGGLVPGPKGKPMLAVVHGGEYVLSNDMLAGRQQPTQLLDAKSANGYTPASSPSQAALTGTAPAAGAPQVTVIANTNASPQAIASQVGWTLRAMA